MAMDVGTDGGVAPGVQVLTDQVTRTVYATDNSIYQVEPYGVALPSRAEQISALVSGNFSSADRRPMVARGAGTGTNGQSLTDGVMVDLKRNLNRIVSIDAEARTAVVEPGLVTARFNAELADHGLFWAPHTSTLNRATVGGMIATDAAGKGSLVHGRAHRHVVALDVVLDDGTPWRAEALSVADATRRAEIDDRVGALWRSLLDLPLGEDADYGLPELARGFSGYGIDRVRRDGLIDPVPLLCGSEGTLAIITSATVKLTPLPSHVVLVVASYESFAAALDDAVELAATKPTAIESFDETTLERGRSSPAWPSLGEVVGDDGGSVLLLEYSGDAVPDVEPVLEALAATGRSRASQVVDDKAKQADAWKVRADAVGLLAKVATGGPELSARPTAMVEDCAVPVAAMPRFIADFRAALDDFGLEYGMFGHADVGCVHVRPALDLSDPGHESLVRAITDRVVEILAEHGGVLWGEHGRGFRGDVAESFLSPETIAIMRQVKTAFDPNDLFNPGKLYRPVEVAEPIIALDEAPLRGHRNRRVALEVRNEFDDAFACNGNGLCHHYGNAEVMCPSYKATGDPALSPKGRADLLRAWLLAEAEAGVDGAVPVESPTGRSDIEVGHLDDALAANLDQCLSCSACSGHCPVEVDIPELKSRFLDRYYANRRRPLSHALMSRFESLAGPAGRLPGGLSRLGAAPVARLFGLVDLPIPKRSALARLPRFEAGRGTEIVLLPDVFTTSLEPNTLATAVEVLERIGYSVAVAPFVASGKFDHVKGRRAAFARAVEAQAELVASVVDDGATPVVIEPAVALLHGHEYPTTKPGYPTEVRYLAEVIEERSDRLSASSTPRAVSLLGHCTERATSPGWLASWQRVLEAVGHQVVVPDIGCCGMAGIFGHEIGNQEMSEALFDLTWRRHVDGNSAKAADDALVDKAPVAVATGYSCRSQAKRFASRSIDHPVMLL